MGKRYSSETYGAQDEGRPFLWNLSINDTLRVGGGGIKRRRKLCGLCLGARREKKGTDKGH